MTNTELKNSSKISLGLAIGILTICTTVGVKIWNVADDLQKDVSEVKAAVAAKPTRAEVAQEVEARVAVALQGLRISESIAELRAVLSVVREDIKEIRHGGK